MAAAAEVDWSALSDEALVESIGDGDERAFEVLYRRYFKRIYGFVDGRLRNRADTEEVVQEVFVNVFLSIGSYRGEAPLAAWVLGLTRRTIAARFKRKRHPTVPLLPTDELDALELPIAALGTEATPIENLECRERIDQLRAASERLSAEQWRLFELHHLDDEPISALAELFEKSPDAIKSNLYRTRKILLAR